jgi:Zn-dependent peptidase ImmA (M78 family)
MKGIRYDNVGIPIISRDGIEVWAEKFISYFDKSCLDQPRPTPLGSICTSLRENYSVNFVFGADLGTTAEGYQYRGRFHIPSKTIYIDKSLEYGDRRFNFTLAHEIAHFVMHKNISLAALKIEGSEISDTKRNLILDHVHSENPREWLEWQANKFASSLLLPRLTLPAVVVDIQRKLGITRLGKIYLDRQPTNISMYNTIISTLVELYETSKTSVKLRLKELGMLVETCAGFDARSRPVVPIIDAMRDTLKSMQDQWD